MLHTERSKGNPPILEARGSLKGRLRWQLKRDGNIVASGDQNNLITDAGLDHFANVNTAGNSDNQAYFREGFRTHAAVGEGSAAPAFADIALGSEVMRVSGAGTSNNKAAVGGVVTALATCTYVFDFVAPYNLTEFGFAPGSGSSLSIRQLFRDGLGTPITISVLANDQLSLAHELEVTFTPHEAAAVLTIDEYDRIGTFLGTTNHNGWASLAGRDNVSLATLHVGRHYAARFWYFQLDPGGPVDGLLWSYPTYPVNTSSGVIRTVDPYIAGSHERVLHFEIDASTSNGLWYGFGIGDDPGNGNAFIFVFDGSFTKANTHTFSFSIKRSWARA